MQNTSDRDENYARYDLALLPVVADFIDLLRVLAKDEKDGPRSTKAIRSTVGSYIEKRLKENIDEAEKARLLTILDFIGLKNKSFGLIINKADEISADADYEGFLKALETGARLAGYLEALPNDLFNNLIAFIVSLVRQKIYPQSFKEVIHFYIEKNGEQKAKPLNAKKVYLYLEEIFDKIMGSCEQNPDAYMLALTEFFTTAVDQPGSLVTINSKQLAQIGQNSRDRVNRGLYVDCCDSLLEWHFALAVCDILNGDYEALDPIIGEQACEMRCPFILDVSTIILEAARTLKRTGGLDYLREAAKDYLSGKIMLSTDNSCYSAFNGKVISLLNDSEVLICLKDTSCLSIANLLPDRELADFIDVAQSLLEMMAGPTDKEFIGPDPIKLPDVEAFGPEYLEDVLKSFNACRYLALCKTYTRNRDALLDQFGIDVDHQSDIPFEVIGSGRTKLEMDYILKQEMSHCSTAYMKYTARKLMKACGYSDTKSMPQMLYDNVCLSKAHINKSGFQISTIPVYAAFRIILMNAFLNDQPIVVTLHRLLSKPAEKLKYKIIKGKSDTPSEVIDDNAIYSHAGSAVLFYKPDRDRGQYIFVPQDEITTEDSTKVCIAVTVASLLNLSAKPLDSEPDFFHATDFGEFLYGFTSCDIGHLLQFIAYHHPPFPSSVMVPKVGNNSEFETTKDCGRSYDISVLQMLAEGNEIGGNSRKGRLELDVFGKSFKLLNVCASNWTLNEEYEAYANLSVNLGIQEGTNEYATVTSRTPFTVLRSMRSRFFAPTHIYSSSYINECLQHDQCMEHAPKEPVLRIMTSESMQKKKKPKK